MRLFIVHAHAEPRSFNGALTQTAITSLREAGHEVRVSDLYAMAFNPVSDRRNFTTVKDPDYFKQQVEEMHASSEDGFAPDIERELDNLFWCDHLVLQFPLWWFGLPAIMKGWVDKVFAMGRTYGGGRWYDRGVFRGRRAICSITTGGAEASFSEHGVNGHLPQILYPIHHGILYFTGFTPLEPFLVYGPARMTQEQRDSALEDWRRAVLALEKRASIEYPGLDAYENGVLRRE